MRFETIEHPIRWIFIFHILGGSLALASFLIPLISKKGGKLHVRAGWIYSYAMILVGLSALIITPWRAMFDPSRTPFSEGFAVFLFFIAVFTLSALWEGIIVLKFKNRKIPSKELRHVGPPILTILFGVIAQIVGLKLHNALLLIFPLLGYLTAKGQLEYWLKPPTEKMHWWYFHMNGMFTACIATITAFLVTAVPRIWPMPIMQTPLLWIAPGLILGTILNRWTFMYKEKFGDIKVQRP